MQESTKASIETTENFIQAFEDWIRSMRSFSPVTRLLYDQDGAILGITEENPKDGELWIEIDRRDFESKYNASNIWLKLVDGKIVDTKPKPKIREMLLVPGDTWYADDDYRLIVGESDGNNSGWSRRSD